MRIDVIIESNKPAAEFTRLAQIAEDYGLGGIWVANNANGRDAFVNFTPFAMQSKRIKLGPIAVSPFELHPLKMAISLLSLNELAEGRAQIVVGAGGGVAEAMGQLPKRMLQPVRECIEILNFAAAGYSGAYKGTDFPLSWMDTRWVTQPKPMIYVGANGPKFLADAASYADGIMVSDFTPTASPGRATSSTRFCDSATLTRRTTRSITSGPGTSRMIRQRLCAKPASGSACAAPSTRISFGMW